MLIECVPNISEGRRPEIVREIAGRVDSAPGALLLDTSSDPDHNRTVLTLAGTPEGLLGAVRALYAAALPRIDMRRHAGVHPRIGAVDVVPFIPLEGATMADCITLARQAAELAAREFGVPAFLYGQAAASENRKRLADIRRGEFEGLVKKLADPAWRPDFGPPAPHPAAGASAVGARGFLVAYNIQLDTGDIRIARMAARAVRESSGGLPGVQAMGVLLPERNQAQVSMNLIDHQATPLERVFQAVAREAARLGAGISSSQIAGLAPRAALGSASPAELKIENWRPELILEDALAEAIHSRPLGGG